MIQQKIWNFLSKQNFLLLIVYSFGFYIYEINKEKFFLNIETEVSLFFKYKVYILDILYIDILIIIIIITLYFFHKYLENSLFYIYSLRTKYKYIFFNKVLFNIITYVIFIMTLNHILVIVFDYKSIFYEINYYNEDTLNKNKTTLTLILINSSIFLFYFVIFNIFKKNSEELENKKYNIDIELNFLLNFNSKKRNKKIIKELNKLKFLKFINDKEFNNLIKKINNKEYEYVKNYLFIDKIENKNFDYFFINIFSSLLIIILIYKPFLMLGAQLKGFKNAIKSVSGISNKSSIRTAFFIEKEIINFEIINNKNLCEEELFIYIEDNQTLTKP